MENPELTCYSFFLEIKQHHAENLILPLVESQGDPIKLFFGVVHCSSLLDSTMLKCLLKLPAVASYCVKKAPSATDPQFVTF